MSHRPSISSRIASLEARIRDAACPRSVAVLVRTMTAHRDVEAIPALLRLLDLSDSYVGSVENALVRYGEHAEDALKAYAVANPGIGCTSALHVLTRIAERARFRRLGCF
jgi:hypothetical protein